MWLSLPLKILHFVFTLLDTHPHPHTHTHTHARARTHAHTHAHRHTNTHTKSNTSKAFESVLTDYHKFKFAVKFLSRDYSDLYFGSLGFDSSLTSWLSYLRYYKVSSFIAKGYYINLKLDKITSSYIQNRYVRRCNSTKWNAKRVTTVKSTYILIKHVL